MTSDTLAILQQTPWSNAAEVAVLTALLLLMFAAGRALVEFLLAFAIRGSDASEQPLRNVNFISIGAGGAIVLIVVWLLRVAHLFSFGAVAGGLVAFVAAAAIWNVPFREFLRRPWRDFDPVFYAYLAGTLAFLVAIDVNSYGLRTTTAMYVQQGWQLFSTVTPETFPSFGELVTAPLLYTGHLISAVFGVLGHLNHVAYFIVGTYCVNALLAPAIPIGAYLFFSRFLSPVPSLVAGWFFCTQTLGNKVWSLRGETIGWIVGFCFLLAVVDTVRGFEDSESTRVSARLWPLVGVFFFSLVLTHGIAAIVAIVAVAYGVVYVLLRRDTATALRILRLGSLAGVTTIVLLSLFTLTYARSRVVERGVHERAHAADAAVAFDNVWNGLPPELDPRAIHSRPPYVPLPAMADISSVLPALSLFKPSYATLPIEDFPRLAIEELRATPVVVTVAIVALPLALLVLSFALPRPLERERWRDLFLTSLLVCAALILVALIADLRSVALYPVSAVRRSFPYVRFFYWLAIGVAAVNLVARLPHRSSSAAHAWLAARERILRSSAAFVLAFGWIFSSANSALGRTSLGGMLGHLVWGTLAIVDPVLPVTTEEAHQVPMLQAMLYLKDHAPRGSWVYSNVLSTDNAFSYLTSGRFSLFEGTNIYQLAPVMQREAEHARTMEIVAASSDVALLAPFDAEYALVYDRPSCDLQCYGNRVSPTNDAWLASSPALRRVFSNGYYTVYRITGGTNRSGAAEAVRLIALCERPPNDPTATIDACSQLLRLAGPVDRNVYYFRALAFAREGRRSQALSDLALAPEYRENTVQVDALRQALRDSPHSDPR